MCCDWLLSGSVEGLVEPHQSMRKCRIVGFIVTQKDLVNPASFLGVHMNKYLTRKVILPATIFSMYELVLVNAPLLQVDWVPTMSEGNKAGLCENDIIQSVILVTADRGVQGPDTEWSFDRISRTAKNSPSVFALLMTVLNF